MRRVDVSPRFLSISIVDLRPPYKKIHAITSNIKFKK